MIVSKLVLVKFYTIITKKRISTDFFGYSIITQQKQQIFIGFRNKNKDITQENKHRINNLANAKNRVLTSIPS